MEFVSTRKTGDVLVAYVSQPGPWKQPPPVSGPEKESMESAISRLGGELMSVADEVGAGSLVLDFSDVRYPTSSFIGKLVAVNKKCQRAGAQMRICNVSPEVREIFAMMKLDTVLNLEESI